MKKIYGVISEETCQSLGYFLSKEQAIEKILTEVKQELQTEDDHELYYIVEDVLFEKEDKS